jgi:hypothetical protein
LVERLQRARERRAKERARETWRAGYVILPLAFVVGLCQLFIPTDLIPSDLVPPHLMRSHLDRDRWTEARVEPGSASAAPSARVDRSATTSAADDADEIAPPRTATPVRVSIHHALGPRNALPAIQLAAYLQGRGFAVAQIRAVESEVERPSVRYFFAGDRADSDRLAETVAAFFAKAADWAPAEVDDFSGALAKPQRGSIEVWLPPSAAGERTSSWQRGASYRKPDA